MTEGKIKFRTQYTKPFKVSRACDGESPVQQHFKDDCDINQVLKRFRQTGVLQTVAGQKSLQQPQFGDFTNVKDYQTALNALQSAQEGFNSLPVRLRQRFNYDPQELLSFISDDANREEAERLGLIKKKPVEKPVTPEEKAGSPEPATGKEGGG